MGERFVNDAAQAYAGPVSADVAADRRRELSEGVGLVAPLVLGLLPHAPTVAELRAELTSHGIDATAETVSAWLAGLGELGLVRVTRGAPGGASAPEHIATTLGRRIASASLAGRPDLAPGLKELERLRGDLLATIGHELRTPLTAVRTSVGLLLDPALDPSPDERQRLLITIGRSADRMQRLLEDLLDLARFRAGTVQLQRHRVDARAVARGALETIEPLVAGRGQRLVVSMPDAAVPIDADRGRLEQALLNLLSNAHKFGPPGSPIELRLDAASGKAWFEVRDEGPGISSDDQALLFERFFVGEGDRSGGVGLGLPTALAIAQGHGGTIEVESAPNAGSRFRLVVPLAHRRSGR